MYGQQLISEIIFWREPGNVWSGLYPKPILDSPVSKVRWFRLDPQSAERR